MEGSFRLVDEEREAERLEREQTREEVVRGLKGDVVA